MQGWGALCTLCGAPDCSHGSNSPSLHELLPMLYDDEQEQLANLLDTAMRRYTQINHLKG